MQNFIIMTDSCCDLNAQEVAELGIRVLPLTFVMDGKSYLDTPDHAQMSPEEFYRRVSAGADCSTSAVSVGEFLAAMRTRMEERKYNMILFAITDMLQEGSHLLFLGSSERYKATEAAAAEIRKDPEVYNLPKVRALMVAIYGKVDEGGPHG